VDAVQITSGREPQECELAVGLYLAFFLKQHPGAVVKKEQKGKTITVAGRQFVAYKSVMLDVPDARSVRTGTVKWICQSPVRPGHPRKNWFIDVSRISDADVPPEVSTDDLVNAGTDNPDLRFETFRSPGRGGQKVNKVETGVRVRHLPTGLTAQSVTARTQAANKKLALQRLEALIRDRNTKRGEELAEAEWQGHDRLERGNAFAVFAGIDFVPLQEA
jgi:peptide chain release factor